MQIAKSVHIGEDCWGNLNKYISQFFVTDMLTKRPWHVCRCPYVHIHFAYVHMHILSQEVREMCHSRYDGCCRIS